MTNPTPSRRYGSLRFWRWWLLGYALLLVVSHAWRVRIPDPGPAGINQETIWVSAPPTDVHEAKPVAIRYWDTDPRANGKGPTVVLLHGSPMAASHVFQKTIDQLRPLGRVVAPDLPGFGYSSRHLADYSFKSHAAYLQEFLVTLDLNQIHLVAYSMGGGVALHLTDTMPDKIASLTFVSAIGVQEFELLGDYHLNHAIHGLQLLVLRGAQWVVPHFGMLDRLPFNVGYARNFYDSDQRPLRRLLEKFAHPLLIVHGRDDAFVPLGAAQEHHRIVPQSHLALRDGGHLLMFRQTSQVMALIRDFVQKVDAGQGRMRRDASAERQQAAQMAWHEVPHEPAHGLLLWLLLILIALATLVSEDLACIGAGMMAARGLIGLLPAVGASFGGIVIGDILLFLAGRYLGRPALNRAPLKWFLSEADLERSARWFQANGARIILVSRFLPGSRLPTYFSAGALGRPLGEFVLYFGVAAVLWTPLLVGLSVWVGGQLVGYYDLFQRYAVWVAVAVIGLMWVLVRLAVPLMTYRGRRLLLSAYRRKSRWEFWSPYLFYPPLVIYVLWLGVRFRCMTLFTAVNPGMPAGGVLGESKSQILSQLGPDAAVPPFCLIDRDAAGETQREQVRAFMIAHGLDYPLVAKPDVGQRGKAVEMVPDEAALVRYLEVATDKTIVQAYVPGVEFGVFYVRHPDHDRGRLLSITDKQRLTLRGDGRHTLEMLILRDERAVCLAPMHFKRHRQGLYEVPADGEVIRLVEVGTHARGALFLDGNHFSNNALREVFDRISSPFEGFYFGRYDVRVPSVEDFQAGRHISVLELNGVTSEVTHIYDPQNSLWRAYADLMQQWRIAFEIAAVNVQKGARPITSWQFLKLLFS